MKKLRLTVQLIFTILTNGYTYGYLNGKIYQGALKYACVPGLNCYSCPGAVASCPIGALQALLNRQGFQIPFGMLGFFFLVGSLLGRFVCGWLCPFGLVQDLLHKIPVFRKRKRLPLHHILKFGKYAVLLLFVCIGSVFLFGGFAKVPAFCKYICPITVFLKPMSYFSLLRIQCDKEKCVSCGACRRVCPMHVDVTDNSRRRRNGTECILCMECVRACPKDAL